MKKQITFTIGILLCGVLTAQTPFKVDKVYNIVKGDTTETYDFMWDEIGIKYINGKAHGDIKIYFENSETGFKKSERCQVFSSEYFDKWDHKKECGNKKLGLIEYRHDWLTGYIKFDIDADGEYDKLVLLK